MVNGQLIVNVSHAAEEAGIHPDIWWKVLGRIRDLHDHNEEHYEHSLRVGWYAYHLAKWEEHSDLHAPLFAGCGHDIGKCDIANDILCAEEFGPEEMEQVKAHTIQGYEKLHDKFLFTALVAGLHHKFQPNGYGIDWEDVKENPTPELKAAAEEMARFIMVCDFFDALTTRDGKFDGTPRQVMDQFFGDHPQRTDWLFANQIP
jgi:hypothetical protein